MTANFRFILVFMTMLIAFLIVSFQATHASEWRREAAINEWCYDLDTITKIADYAKRGDTEGMSEYVSEVMDNGKCGALPPGFGGAFSPKEEIESYDNFMGAPAVLIRGNIIRPDDTEGPEAFIIIALSDLGRFKNLAVPEKTKYQNI